MYCVILEEKQRQERVMSIEVEIKLRISDKKRIEKTLKEIGFRKAKLVMESDTYYMADHHDFVGLDEALRVRSTENKITGERSAAITYKGAKLDNTSMTRQELETSVGDGNICREILERIGFQPVPVVEKLRQYYHRDNITACVDAVTNLGDYLELEIIVDAKDKREDALDQLEQILHTLGYSMQDTTRTSYLSMLLKKKKK